jgi:hypothetical protein
MAFFLLARKALLIVIGLALAGCAKEDGSRIVGKWRAERFEVMSLKLPVGPELEITPHELSTASDVRVPISAITQDGEAVTLETELIGLTFNFVEPDRMYIALPIIGRIYYRRVNVVPAAVAVPPSPVPVSRAQRAPLPLPEPQAAALAGQSADEEPPYAKDYAQALALVRQGDHDGAVRCLHDAFKHGFRDVAQLAATAEFDSLKPDVRYQALLARYSIKPRS